MRFPRLPRLPVSRRRLTAHRDYLARRVEDLRISLSEVEQQRDELLDDVDRSCAWAMNVMDERDSLRARVAELEQAIRTFVTSEDTHEPGPFVKDGNWHTGPCVEGGPRMEDVYPDGFQVCADEECFAYWPCDVERLRRVLDGHDRHVVQHPVRRESCCYVCGSPAWLTGQLIYLGGEQHWRHAECQPPKAADVRGHDRQEPQECICWASSYCPLHEHRDTPRGGRR